jgi:hypothetical protein
MPRGGVAVDLSLRFWSKVQKADGCWIWTARRNAHGYGVVRYKGASCLAHRAIWEHTHGPIPHDRCVLHRCDNPACVRLDHLWLGTQIENIEDRVQKKRSRGGRVGPKKPARLCGTANPMTKLSDAAIETIARRLDAGEKLKPLAEEFHVSVSLISLIRQGHRRKAQ